MKCNLATYLNLYGLLKADIGSREERRAFGLEHNALKEKPLVLLLRWTQDRVGHLKRPLLSEKVSRYLYGITLILGVLAFGIGLFSGIALLSYSGKEPVNVIYFMAMVIFLPLFTMTLAIISMFRANASQSVLVHISPAFWMERILRLLPGKVQASLDELQVNPSILNWLIIRRSQMLALLFSIGLLLALLGVVATKDIAFAWSTTLHISPKAFHALLETVAWPWRFFFPSAVPSLELIEQSQYFRLGGKLDPEMVKNASQLGEWWKFLACSTLFYAIFLRAVLWLWSIVGYKRALARALFALEGTEKLLREMNEPLITTSSPGEEKPFREAGRHYSREIEDLEHTYAQTFGWAMSEADISVLNDARGITSVVLEDVGGTNTLDEDREIILKAKKEVLLYVKAWEPPTMDFVDFLEDLVAVADKIVIVPVGLSENGTMPKADELEVWGRKLKEVGKENVWMKI